MLPEVSKEDSFKWEAVERQFNYARSTNDKSNVQFHSDTEVHLLGGPAPAGYVSHNSDPPLDETFQGSDSGKEELQNNDEGDLLIPWLQSSVAETDILSLFMKISEMEDHKNMYGENKTLNLLVHLLQSDLLIEKNKLQLLLDKAQDAKAEQDGEYQVLLSELLTVKDDTRKYDNYIGNECYSFHNETWEYLKNVGYNELRSRKQVLLQQKTDLNNRRISCREKKQLYLQLLADLNEEEIRRGGRLREYSINSEQNMLEQKGHVLHSILQRLELEQNKIQTLRKAALKRIELKAEVPSLATDTACILKRQKLGCTFDFMLKHRIYKDGNVTAYNDVVDIFEKKPVNFEVPQSVFQCTQKLLISSLESRYSRLQCEKNLYLQKLKLFSIEEERRKSLEENEPILHHFPDANLEDLPFKFGAPSPLSNLVDGACGLQDYKLVNEIQKEKTPPVPHFFVPRSVSNTKDKTNEGKANQKEFSETHGSKHMRSPEQKINEERAKLKELNSSLEYKRKEGKTSRKEFNRTPGSKPLKYGNSRTNVDEGLIQVKKNDSLMKLQETTINLTMQVNKTLLELSQVKKENSRIRKTLDKILNILEKKGSSEREASKMRHINLDGSEQLIADETNRENVAEQPLSYGQPVRQDRQRETTENKIARASAEWSHQFEGRPQQDKILVNMGRDATRNEHASKLATQDATNAFKLGNINETNIRENSQAFTIPYVKTGLQHSKHNFFTHNDETSSVTNESIATTKTHKLTLFLDSAGNDGRAEHLSKYVNPCKKSVPRSVIRELEFFTKMYPYPYMDSKLCAGYKKKFDMCSLDNLDCEDHMRAHMCCETSSNSTDDSFGSDCYHSEPEINTSDDEPQVHLRQHNHHKSFLLSSWKKQRYFKNRK